jgi:hypothetical protein
MERKPGNASRADPAPCNAGGIQGIVGKSCCMPIRESVLTAGVFAKLLDKMTERPARHLESRLQLDSLSICRYNGDMENTLRYHTIRGHTAPQPIAREKEPPQ